MAEAQKTAAGNAPPPALTPLEAEVIGLFVQLSRALGHPCKIYNILAVGAPVIYVGPTPSHVTEILGQIGNDYPSIHVDHGQTDILANKIQALRRKKTDRRMPLEKSIPAPYSKDAVLPALVATLESSSCG